jgi:hypothetical protein
VTVYSIYEPQSQAPDLAARAERLAFVKEGFSWPALLIPAFWLIYQRMWIELGVFIAILAGLSWAFGVDSQGQALFGWAASALILLFAFEANDLRAAALERRGYRLAGLAMGRGRDAAERGFFESWLPQQTRAWETGAASGDGERGSVPMSYPAGRTRGEGDEVIGSFPGA